MKYKMLTESVDVKDVLSQLYMKSNPKFYLHRGSDPFDEITKMEFRFRKQAVDTLDFIHDKVNELAEDKFGLPIRNLLFCYPDEHYASSYGTVSIIVPIGDNYRMFANHSVNDFTEDLNMSHRFYHRAAKDTAQRLIDMEILWNLTNENVTLTDVLEDIMRGIFFKNDNNAIEDFNSYLKNNIADAIEYKVFRKEITQTRANECFHILEENNIISILTEKFKELYDQYLINKLNNYINGIHEINTRDDVETETSPPEIMLYAPDGFYVIPNRIFNEIRQ